MRPIDADALKKEVKRLLGLAHDREAQTFGNDIPDTVRVRYQTQYNERSAFCNLIDNAPTVEPVANCSHCDYFKFSQLFVDNIAKLMADYNIETYDDLMNEINRVKDELGGRE